MKITVSRYCLSIFISISNKIVNPNEPLGFFIYTKGDWGAAPLPGGFLPSKISKLVDMFPLDLHMHSSSSIANGLRSIG